MRNSIYTYLLAITFLFGLVMNGHGQEDMNNLSREGTLIMLSKVDSLINDYAQLCSFMGGGESDQASIDAFLSLFETKEVMVFDDVNPNISSEDLDRIVERNKSVTAYVNEIQNDFLEFSSNVSRSTAASAAERIYQKEGKTYLTVSLSKSSTGTLKDSTKCRSIRSDANLELWIRMFDTINYDMAIAEIRKEGNLGIDWDYTLARFDLKKTEILYHLSPMYSHFFPHGFKTTTPPNKLILNQNEFFSNETLSDMGLNSNYLWGSFGINADIEFRRVWRNENKNSIRGVSIGIGAGFYNSFFEADNYLEVQSIVDKDGDSFYAITNVSGLKESWMILTGDIPIKYSSEKWKNFRKGRYFSIGPRLSYVTGFSSASGSYSIKGYYPEYNVLLEDISNYGFVSDQDIEDKYDPPLRPYNVAVEMSLGRKKRTKNGNLIVYVGLNVGAYVLDFIEESPNTSLFAPDFTYQGLLPLMEKARMGYIGINIGFKKSDPSENILKRKEIERSQSYSTGIHSDYRRVKIDGIDLRNFPVPEVQAYDQMKNSDRPVLFKMKKKDPLKLLNEHIRKKIKLSAEEKTRIKEENDYIIRVSFIVDHKGSLRNVSLKNQNHTEFGREFIKELKETSGFWDAGLQEGLPVNTRIEFMFKN